MCRSNVEKNFDLEDLYDSDVSSVHIATHKANQEKTVIKMFKRDKLANRVDLQNKVCRTLVPIHWSKRHDLNQLDGDKRPVSHGSLTAMQSVAESDQLISEPSLACHCAQVKQEWDVHSSLSHPNIIRSYLALEDSQGVKLFMEYAGESDAYSFISNKQRLSLREADACQLVYDVLTALRFMHSQVNGYWARYYLERLPLHASCVLQLKVAVALRHAQSKCVEGVTGICVASKFASCAVHVAGRLQHSPIITYLQHSFAQELPATSEQHPQSTCRGTRLLIPRSTRLEFLLQGIVHRDIKSENVFRTASGVWKLGDFGSSLRIGDKRVLDKQTIKLEGTYSFAAPEYIAIWNGFHRTQLLEATTFKV